MQNRCARAVPRLVLAALGLAFAAPAALAATYTWNAASGSFGTSTNWTPNRAVPAATDVLVFDGGVTPTAAVSDLSTQTIAQLVVQNGAAVTLASSATAVLTVAGDAGTDFDVNGATLTTLAGNIIQLVLGAGATGTVRNSGVLAVQGASHKVLPADADALHFQSGGRFVSDVGLTGNPFGNSGTANAVVFESGTAFVFRAGSNPFGLAQPASRVTFQTGSLYRHESLNLPSLAGRTYADIEWDNGVTTLTASAGSAPWTMDHLRFFSGTLNVTAALPTTIRGDLSVAPGATFNYSPSAATTLSIGGSGPQAISSTNDAAAGTGNLSLGPNANVSVAPTSTLTLAAGDLIVQGALGFPGVIACAGTNLLVMAPGSAFSPGPSAWVDGTLVLNVPAGSPSVLFPVGDAAAAAPVQLDFTSVGVAGQLAARADAGDHPLLVGSGLDGSKSVNRWWRVGPAGGVLAPPTFTTCDVTLNYPAGDLDGGATASNFAVGKFDSPSWSLPAHTTGTATSITTTGIASFSDFEVAEPSSCPAITVTPATLASGNSGSGYSASFGASGGTGPYTFAVVIGSLPPGLTLSGAGSLSGTPAAAGTYPFTVAATDAGACAGVRSYTFVVNGPCPTIAVTPAVLPGGAMGMTYGQPLSASGGTPPYTFAVSAGALPGGLALSPVGVVSGTCTALGSFGFDVTATDANGCAGTQSYTVSVTCPAIAVFPTIFLAGVVGTPFSAACSGGGGTAPYTFAVSSGALPPGLSLDSGGALAGTPTAAGSYPFVITTTDAYGCTGNRAYTFYTVCPAVAMSPASLPGGTQGVPYGALFSGSGGTSPYTFTVSAGTLPAGLTLSPGGALAGTPTAAGSFPFTVSATDAYGCGTSTPYSLGIAPGDYVTAGPPASCISSATPCVAVPITFTRLDATPMRAYSVTVQLSPELALCGAQAVPAGLLPPGSGGTFFFVTPGTTPGEYVVDESTLGLPCGVTGGGTLFTLYVTSTSPLWTSGSVTVTAVTVRDCANAPIPGVPGSGAMLAIDGSTPAAIPDLAAAQQKTGNDADGTTKIALTFTPPFDAAAVAVYRKAFGGYPQYDENGGVAPAAPATPAAAVLAGWTLTPVTASGQADEPPARDFWYYVAFSTDACGNVSAVSNRTNGTLDYHLGDVANGVTACAGENAVTTADLTLLGANYHTSPPLNGSLECLDVGPTSDYSVNARPTTDNYLDFEDLILYSINFGQVSAPQLAHAPAGEEGGGASAVWAEAPAQVAAGARVRALVRVRGEGDLQGLSAKLRWDASVVRPAGLESGGWLESQGGVVLGAGDGAADGVLLGVGAHGMRGEGTLAAFTFEAIRTGAPAIAIARAVGRDAANGPVALAGRPGDAEPERPTRTALGPAFPNPFRGSTAFRLAFADDAPARLVVYDLGGRRVRTLLDSVAPAGERIVTWDGRDDAGLALPPGLFVMRFTSAGVTQSHRVLLVK